MPLSAQNFSMTEGDTLTLSFSLYEADGTTALNLTGVTVRWKLARSVTSAVLISKTNGDGITVGSPATGGTLTVELAALDTHGLYGRYYHEMEVTDLSSNVSTVATGHAVISAGLIASGDSP
jgi:hypothetical protein